MQLGPMKHPVALVMPDGTDADVHIYLASDSKHMWNRMTIRAVKSMSVPEGILEEASKMVKAPPMLEIATDWRLMTKAEVHAYRVNEIEEERRASEDHPQGAGQVVTRAGADRR